ALAELLGDELRRAAMRKQLERSRPPDGATAVAEWITQTLEQSSTHRE
ncbi:MAG: hypothetical protein IAG13_06740, partial [Deltaproteobacteria bacterium]|nr:hypothetical protein [Nannocystaceae bacterium]